MGVAFLAVVSVVGAVGSVVATDASAEAPVTMNQPTVSMEGMSKSPIVQAAVIARTHEIDEHNRQLWLAAQKQHEVEVQAARAAQERARAARAQSTPTPRRSGGVNWDGIARCETGGDWGMVGRTFSGGLGFANTTWNGFGGREFADFAGHATREQQIIVAERVYAKYGLSGWGCRAYG
jgi:hypothetical protein